MLAGGGGGSWMIEVAPPAAVPVFVVVPDATPKARAQLELADADALAAFAMAAAWLPCRALLTAS